MSVHKRIHKGGSVTWDYKFYLPGSTKESPRREQKYGFATKKEAIKAEAARRVEVEAAVKAPSPRSLKVLLAQFFGDSENLAPKTLERYKELVAYLHADLVEMPISEITAMHLHAEWKRLKESGGHTRKDKTPRPLSAKTVRHVCGVVSAAFGRAQRWGLVVVNPTTASAPPKVPQRSGIALPPDQTRLLSAAANIPWLPAFLELDAATGCRRGELLALEWSDLDGAALTVARSLSQTRCGLKVKATKSEKPRSFTLPLSAIAVLDAHRKAQDEERLQMGADLGGLIFCKPGGDYLRPDSVSSAVSLLCRRLKLPKGVSLHTIRHSFGSQLLAAGVPITEVSRRLGHSTPQTTMRVYAHALPDQDAEAAEKWEQFQKAGETKGARQ